MSIVISGYLVVSTTKLRNHAGHTLHSIDQADGTIAIRCMDDEVDLEVESPQIESLPCGCPDDIEHQSGVQMQKRLRRDYRLDSRICVGCYLGDDGPSMHSCYVHQF